MESELFYWLEAHENPNITVPFSPGNRVPLKDFPFERIGKWEAFWWRSSDLDIVLDAIKDKSNKDKTDIECFKNLKGFGHSDVPVYVKVRTKEQASLVTYILNKFIFNYVVVLLYHECTKATKEDIEEIFKNAGITLYLSEYRVPEYASKNYDRMKPVLVYDNSIKK